MPVTPEGNRLKGVAIVGCRRERVKIGPGIEEDRDGRNMATETGCLQRVVPLASPSLDIGAVC